MKLLSKSSFLFWVKIIYNLHGRVEVNKASLFGSLSCLYFTKLSDSHFKSFHSRYLQLLASLIILNSTITLYHLMIKFDHHQFRYFIESTYL